jgi:hypothetical protein
VSARRAASIVLAMGLAGSRALAAPMGAGVEAVGVLSLEADRASDLAAKTMSNALRQAVLDAPEYTLHGENSSLIVTAVELKCPLGKGGLLPDERVFDDACLRKVGKFLGLRRFFWGYVTTARGDDTIVRLHFWQQGQPDRVTALPYDAAARDRIAMRLYRKLVTPEKVGDLALSGAAQGELVVDGQSQGSYAPGVELTLFAGEHAVEVRQGPRVVARASARVEPGGRAEAKLEPVAEPAPSPPSRLPTESSPIVVRPKASAWPWALGGAAAAGLAGAGVFWALRSGVRSDLERGCFEGNCPEYRDDDLRRGELYSTLAGVSLGVGLAAGAGLAAYLLTPRRARPMAGVVVVPTPGGGVAGLAGAF